MSSGELIHCTDGNKQEIHPAFDTGDRDGCYHFIKWATTGMHDWVHESRIVVLAKKRQRSKTQRFSEGGTVMPRSKKARPNNHKHKSNRSSMPASKNKQTSKPATRRSFSGRKTVLRKNAASESRHSEIISIHSDSDEQDTELTSQNGLRTAKRYRSDKTGKDEKNPIDICSDHEQKEPDYIQDATNASSADAFRDDAFPDVASFSSLGTQDFCSQDEAEGEALYKSIRFAGGRKKVVARKTASLSKAANIPVAWMPTVFPSKVDDRPVARMTTLSPPNVDDCPVAMMHNFSSSRGEDRPVTRMPTISPSNVYTCLFDVARMPATKSRSDQPLITEPEAFDSSADGNDESLIRRRVRTEFYQPEHQPLKSTRMRFSPAPSCKDASNNVDKRRTVLCGRKTKTNAIPRKKQTTPAARWTAKSLRNVNRYTLDAGKYPE